MANRNTQGFGLVPAGSLAGVSVHSTKVSTLSMPVIAQLFTMAKR